MEEVSSLLQARRNNVLNVDPKIANNNITTHGSDWLWAVMALQGILLLGMIIWTFVTSARRRAFHCFSTAILLVATIYYYAMASNLGGHAVPVEFRRRGIPGRTRQVFWVRWIGYFINFSLIFFSLLLLSGVGWANILFTIGLTMLWATMLLVGGLVSSSYKWGFYVFALLIYFFIIWQVLGVARKHASRVDLGAHKIFTSLAAWTLFLMLLYPIAWGLSEGGNVLKSDSEAVFYGVLDIFSQGIFSLALIVATRNLDFDRMGLSFTEYGRIHDHDQSEKVPHHNGHNGAHDGGATLSAPGGSVGGTGGTGGNIV
ncbi:family A G protein-coupled receptor-like protein [Choiromyces venosus 120613-1]|uniref:Family A G protein-coupled receptor-like protein n=1 Tax=Choiromyces venosus 120613-1 TaxID=1336337 RepID=A0A3N4JJ96_9PEZI|nr:family A G protein-coupled receptor-like protein [Choiromyces venosus 120613-1]